MEFEKYLQKYNAQEKIDKLARLYKNRRIIIYGAGQFARAIFDNYDLSKLNIVAVADRKFEDKSQRDFYGYNCVTPNNLGILDYDLLLIANFDYGYFLQLLDDHILYQTKNAGVEIRPLIKLSFKDIFLKKL